VSCSRPRAQYYVKIQSLPSWVSGTGRHPFARGTYYVALTSLETAALEIPQTTYRGGN
jgi:hypothetical protein